MTCGSNLPNEEGNNGPNYNRLPPRQNNDLPRLPPHLIDRPPELDRYTSVVDAALAIIEDRVRIPATEDNAGAQDEDQETGETRNNGGSNGHPDPRPPPQ